MAKPFTESELKTIAAQLRCPSGEDGQEMGDAMHKRNISMTRAAFSSLQAEAGNRILELGHGSARHVPELLSQADDLNYCGIDISDTMHHTAKSVNADLIAQEAAQFELYDGVHLPLANGTFNRVFTVNTIYFWEEPQTLANEIYRVLAPGGRFCLVMVQAEFLRSMPFARFGFTTYEASEVRTLMTNAGFSIHQLHAIEEQIERTPGEIVNRAFWVWELNKA